MKASNSRTESNYVHTSANYIRLIHSSNISQHALEFLEGELAGDPPVVTKHQVLQSLSSVKTNRSCGPDKHSGKLLKSCKNSLLYIIHQLFQMSFATITFPTAWKLGEIIPVPKKKIVRELNDLRPITLTFVLSKCLEKIALSKLLPYVEHALDPLQFAYRSKRSTNDAVCTLIHHVTKHLDISRKHYARCLFIDYSSAFNTLIPELVINKPTPLGVSDRLNWWILDFLTERTQYVKTKLETSTKITINTGAPQGCVLSPVLFVLYINDL